MNEQEAVDRLEEIMGIGGTVTKHILADKLIVEFLKDQGFKTLAELYDEIANDVWYS